MNITRDVVRYFLMVPLSALASVITTAYRQFPDTEHDRAADE